MSEQNVYLALFHFAKSACSTAAKDIARSSDLFRILNVVRGEMMTISHPLEGREISKVPSMVDIENAAPQQCGGPKTPQPS
jgi:hypothetical protein